MPETMGFVSGRKRAVISITSLVLYVVLAGALTGLEWWSSVNMPDWETSGSDEASVFALVMGVAGVQMVIVSILTPVAFLQWLHRSVRNAAALGPPLSATPRQAVIAWFIPLVALVWPYRIVRRLYASSAKRSEPVAGDWLRAAPWVFPTWWLAWVVTEAAGNVSLRKSLSDDPASVALAAEIDRFSYPFSVVAALGAIAVVRSITARQEAQAADASAEGAASGV